MVELFVERVFIKFLQMTDLVADVSGLVMMVTDLRVKLTCRADLCD
jgi:hypothetical protein